MQVAAMKISQNFVFEHPSLLEMAETIAMLVDPTNAGKVQQADTTHDIVNMLDLYTSGLPKDVSQSDPDSDASSIVVLLTGSTGNVGSHVLAALLADSRISKVYTFNRSSRIPSPGRQSQAFIERKLSLDLLSGGKLVQLFGDLSLDNFGLDGSMYNEACIELSDREVLCSLHANRFLQT